MSNKDRFGTIENTQEFLLLLSDKIDEIVQEARKEISTNTVLQQVQRAQAWQVILYTMTKLSAHIANSRRLMNDLSTLRKALHDTSK